ncbi:MAG TPA: sialidase family protein, partial [Vicinamibacteria bacterium]|nr:sialidase family protein [Vicinamibacteria bacterium]
RQNEPVIGASSVNAEHLLAAANDYRTIDVADDFGLGETNEGFFQSLVASVSHTFAKWLGIPSGGKGLGSPAAVPDAWIGVYRSCNRGQTWVGSLVPGSPNDVSPASLASPLRGLETASDPWLVPAHDGLMYLGGLAFTREGLSKIFVARYTDRNNLEGGNCFVYDFTTVVAEGAKKASSRFVDKPAMAVDVPRGGAAFGSVYIAYAEFQRNMTRASIQFAFSTDGGRSFSSPKKLSDGLMLSQGVALAVNPTDGTVYVVWRDFLTNQIYFTSSQSFAPAMATTIPSGRKRDEGGSGSRPMFAKPRPITPGPIQAFDQPTDFDQFRTNGFPSIAADGNTIMVVWQELVNSVGVPDPLGSPRIVLSLSRDRGRTWTAQRATDIAPRIEEEFQPGLGDIIERPAGPQVMPTISHSAGQWMLSYYESRDPNLGLDGYLSGVERQLDVRAVLLDRETGQPIGSSVQVSQYSVAPGVEPRILEINEGYPAVHRANLTMFRAGTVPFDGDYISLTPAVPLVKTNQTWASPISPEDVPGQSFHEIHTDNRNVVFPGGDILGSWDQYTSPGSGALSCLNPGSRNQDIYTSEITADIIASSPSIFKPLLQPDGTPMPRTFVVYVENRTAESRLVNLEAFGNEPGTLVSFDQEDDGMSSLADDFEILPFSTMTRTVYVRSVVIDGSARVDVRDAFSQELLARVVLNKAPSAFALANSGIASSEFHAPRLSNPRLSNLGPSNPRLSNLSVSSPRLSNPRLSNEALPDSALATTQTSVTVTNEGNTTSVFSLLTALPNADELLASGKYAFQVIVQRTASAPGVGMLDPTCSPVVVLQDEVISSVADPRLSNTGDPNPRLSNPRLSNTTFYLEPAEGASGPVADPGNEDQH